MLILIQTVGTGGPKNPVHEALAFSVRDRQPQLVVCWCSKESKRTTLPKIMKCLGQPAPARKPRFRTHVCKDENDVGSLTSEYTKQLDKLRAEFPEAQIEIDFTSGTKPMSAAAVAVGLSRRIPRLHYAVGPRDESGRATATDRLCSLDTGHLVAQRLLEELGQVFNDGGFAAVLLQATPLARQLVDTDLKARAASLSKLADAYEHWSRFDWKGAAHKLGPLVNLRNSDETVRCGWDLDFLKRQVAHLRQCASSWNAPERLVDLLANAQRCFDRGRFDDAVARLYRLVEYVGQVRFSPCFDRDPKNDRPTSDVPIERLAARAPRLAKSLTRENQPVPPANKNLGLEDTLFALHEAGDPVGAALLEQYWGGPLPIPGEGRRQPRGPLAGYLSRRNQSLLAHGSRPVEANDARKLAGLVREALSLHLKTQALSLDALEQAATFAKCPWARE
jgi:CRISPR-associated protein (TIGR02710 family)